MKQLLLRTITRNKIHGKMGIRASDTAEISFEDVRVPAQNLVGAQGRGFYQLMDFFNTTRAMVAGQGVGLARQLAYKAAWQLDRGKIDPKLSAMAKFYAGETAVWVADKALQLHGGYGYIDEYDIQRFYRDAKILDIYEGTKEAEKLTIAKCVLAECAK
jgi:alkylation response protein AidB-like acyl-CoA dehydrogenase